MDDAQSFLLKAVGHENFPSIYHDTLLFIAVVVGIYILKQPISDLLSRIRSNKNAVTGETNFNPIPFDGRESKFESATQLELPPVIEDDYDLQNDPRIAHLFWLGSDLMDAIGCVAYVPNKTRTNNSLRQVRRHFIKSGLKHDGIVRQLDWIIDVSEKTLESDWLTEKNRKDILNEILTIQGKIAKFIEESAGSGFKPFSD